MTPNVEDYRAMYAQTLPDGRFPLPTADMRGYVSADTHVLVMYVLDVREALDRPLTTGEFRAIQARVAELAHQSTQAALRRELRSRATTHRTTVQATYDSAFRAGYRARKILHDQNSQRAYVKGYARAQADAQAAREAE